jgi:hypothetical protein
LQIEWIFFLIDRGKGYKEGSFSLMIQKEEKMDDVTNKETMDFPIINPTTKQLNSKGTGSKTSQAQSNSRQW